VTHEKLHYNVACSGMSEGKSKDSDDDISAVGNTIEMKTQ